MNRENIHSYTNINNITHLNLILIRFRNFLYTNRKLFNEYPIHSNTSKKTALLTNVYIGY